MHDTDLLSQIVILFGTAVVVALLFRVLRAPTIIGFLITGVLIGPPALGLIERDAVEEFAEIGLVLLLFTIGLELSPRPLLRSAGLLLRVTAVQLGVIIVCVTALVVALSLASWAAAVLIGCAAALSSTAIALKQLSDRGEVSSTLGKILVGVLLLQDVFVIVILVALPVVAGVTGESGPSPLSAAIAFALLVATTIVAHRFMPWALDQIVGRGGRELATLFAVLMAGGGAWAAQSAGWPPALGACIAGLILAEVDMRHQLVAEITPFRDVFNALFFISLGMLVDIEALLPRWPLILLLVASILAFKTVVTTGAVLVGKWPLRIALQAGLGLCTVSEFGYILVREIERAGFVTETLASDLVGVIVGTMILGAPLFHLGPWLADRVSKRLDEKELEKGVPDSHEVLDRHVLIVGYGVNGQNLAQVLKSTHIPFCVVEMNLALANRARAIGAPVIIGDATRLSILRHAGLDKARVLVIAVNDTEATRRIVSQARAARPHVFIVAQSFFATELEELSRRGADIVIAADFEASIQMFLHVLEQFEVPENIRAAQVAAARAGGYGALRGLNTGRSESLEELLKVLQLTATQTFFLSESSPACRRSIAELALRTKTGASIIAVVRDRQPYTNPAPDMELEPNDVLVLVGSHAQLLAAKAVLEPESLPSEE